jgi:hypothetical protein
VEVIDYDHRVRQGAGDRGAVDRARVDRHEPDLVLPVLAAVIEPAGDRGAGAPGDLAQQPPGAGQVGEAGPEPLTALPRTGRCVSGPLGFAAAGLIDAQHHRRVRLGQQVISVRGVMPVRDRPAHPVCHGG